MPASFVSLFPQFAPVCEVARGSIKANLDLAKSQQRAISYGLELASSNFNLGLRTLNSLTSFFLQNGRQGFTGPLSQPKESEEKATFFPQVGQYLQEFFEKYQQDREGEIRFLEFLMDEPPPQSFETEFGQEQVLLDLPSVRLIDFSKNGTHKIDNYAVVVAPRAGHHSNIAERVAISMRDMGLTRMAVVEQKCCEDIPLEVDGVRHHEGFSGQVDQYKRVLEHLMKLTGKPSHVVAVCQPGPLLLSTVILHPHLAKTFGSAGSPMDTEGESGFLTDFARKMGPDYIDFLLSVFGNKVEEDCLGVGRRYYDGRAHVLGFYYLGYEQHVKNFAKLLEDLKLGNEESAKRQMEFYQWYNTAYHFPASFIRDTYKKVFVGNDLVNNRLVIGDKKVRLSSYPERVPIWALGGTNDNIAPAGQATGHLKRIETLQSRSKLKLICDAGHMGLFRSRKILGSYYKTITDFVLANSDVAGSKV